MTPNEAFNMLIELAVYGVMKTERPSTICAVEIVNSPNLRQCIALSTQGARKTESQDLPDARLRLEIETVLLILDNLGEVDFRVSPLTESIEYNGDYEIVRVILEALKRPTPSTVERFKIAERLTEQTRHWSDVVRVDYNDMCRETLVAHATSSQPLVVQRCGTMWPVLERGLDWIKQEYGNTLLPIEHMGRPFTLAGYAELLEVRRESAPDRSVYSGGCRLPVDLEDLFPPAWFSRAEMIYPQLWFGAGANSDQPITTLHRDRTTGFLCQVHGRKRFRLLPPSEASRLNLEIAFNTYQRAAIPDVHSGRMDTTRHDETDHINFIDVEIDAGDMIVTPAGWFHCVFLLDDPSFSVSYFLTEETEEKIRSEPPSYPRYSQKRFMVPSE